MKKDFFYSCLGYTVSVLPSGEKVFYPIYPALFPRPYIVSDEKTKNRLLKKMYISDIFGIIYVILLTIALNTELGRASVLFFLFSLSVFIFLYLLTLMILLCKEQRLSYSVPFYIRCAPRKGIRYRLVSMLCSIASLSFLIFISYLYYLNEIDLAIFLLGFSVFGILSAYSIIGLIMYFKFERKSS